jgi:hypothetical protein
MLTFSPRFPGNPEGPGGPGNPLKDRRLVTLLQTNLSPLSPGNPKEH